MVYYSYLVINILFKDLYFLYIILRIIDYNFKVVKISKLYIIIKLLNSNKMKTFLVISVILSSFLVGFLANSYITISSSDKEFPLNNLFSRDTDRNSPSDIIKESDIEISEDRLIIHIKDPLISSYEDTNSMDPVFDFGHNGIEIKPNCYNLIKGDIIAYRATWTQGTVVHRIVEINQDNFGLLFTAKGDNSSIDDPQKIRCSEIKYQVIGVLY